MFVHADALETLGVNSDSKVSVMGSKQRSLKLKNQRTFPSVLCRCLFPQSDYGPNNNKPSDDRNNQLLPSSVLQSVKLDGSRADEENNEYVPLNVRLPSSAILTDAILSQVREKDPQVSCNNSSRFSIQTWRRFRFSKRKSVIRNEARDHYVDGSALHSVLDETVKEVDKPVVFSPLPSQVVPDPGLHARSTTALLGPRSEVDKGKKCFVIDLDETLVHSSFKVIDQADFKVGVEIDGITHRVYVLKRPHVDTFLSTMANLYECVLFTASLAKYADPVADFIDKWNTFRYRLFRESCVYHRGNYVKDISNLGRPINQVVILDNSPASYMFHAHHAVQISSWFDDVNDRALLDLIPYFERLASHPNVVEFLRTNHPPTPSAAVGSIGLSLGVLGAPSAAVGPHVSESAGRSTATDPVSSANSIISSVRPSSVASPLPPPSSEPKPVTTAIARREHLTASRVDPQPLPVGMETRRAHSVLQRHSHAPHMASVSSARRLLGPTSMPVCASPVAMLASPSSLSMLTAPGSHRTPAGNALPTPVSLAAYVPVSTCLNTPVTISKPSSGNAAKLTVHPSNNSGVGLSPPSPAATLTSSVTIATDGLTTPTAARPAPDSVKRLPFTTLSTDLQTSSTRAYNPTASVDLDPVSKATGPPKAGPRVTATSQSNVKATASSNRAVWKGFFGGLTATQATGSSSITPKTKRKSRH